VQGIAVQIAARIASLAAASEILVSRTVKDLVAGSVCASTTEEGTRSRGCRTRWNSTQPQAEAGNTTRIGQRGLRSLLLAHLYGPAARCKPKVMIWRSLVLRFCIRPLRGADRSLAIMDIRARPISFSDRPSKASWVTRSRTRRRDRSSTFSNLTRRPRRVSSTPKWSARID